MSRPPSPSARRPRRSCWRHVLPNTYAPLIVQATFLCGSAILLEAILSFLGVGMPTDTPTWGNIIADGRSVVPDPPEHDPVSRRFPRGHRARRSICSATACATRSILGCRRRYDDARARPRSPRSEDPAAGAAPIAPTRSRASASPSTPARSSAWSANSGSGKSVISFSVMGLLDKALEGRIRRDPAARRECRRRRRDALARAPLHAHGHDLPGADDRAEPGDALRRADRRGAARAHEVLRRASARRRSST